MDALLEADRASEAVELVLVPQVQLLDVHREPRVSTRVASFTPDTSDVHMLLTQRGLPALLSKL